MIKSIVASACLVATVVTFTVVGCGGSTNHAGGGTGSDSGAGSGPPADGGTTADAATGTGNPPLPDGSIYPHGTQLAAGSVTLAIDGVTSDDYVIYTDLSSLTAYAISLAAGSKPISLGSVDTNNDVTVIGRVVFLGTNADQNGVGAASIWVSGAAAASSLSAATAVQGPFAVSADGTHVLFIDAINAAETTASIAAVASDGTTGRTVLVPSIDYADIDCFPQLARAGTYGVAAYCIAGEVDAGEPDGGANPNVATVSSFAGPTTWARASIASSVQNVFSVDQGGTTVIVNGAAGTVAYPIAGGSSVLIDATGEVGGVTYTPGLLTSDGSHLIYTTTTNALERAAITSPASPVELAPAGSFADVFQLSPDGNWVVGTLSWSDGEGNLFLAATTPDGGGPPTALSFAPSSGIQGDIFTADSTQVLFYTAVGQTGGTLTAAAIGGGPPLAVGTNALTDLATTGAKIVFNSNYDSATGGADLQAIDTSTTATTVPTVLVTQADPAFYLNTSKTVIVYTWSYQTGPSSGLWTMPAP